MKKLVYFLFFLLSGCDFSDSLSELFGPKLKEKVYIVNSSGDQESYERIISKLQSLNMVYDASIAKISSKTERHRKIWQHVADGTESQVIVLEDNVRFEKGFKRNLQRYIKDLPQDWDIAFLVIGRENNKYGCFISVGDIFRDIDEVKGHPYVARIQKTNRVYGLYGYVINKKGAKKLLEITKNTSENIGDIIFQKGGINTGYIKAYVSMFKLLEPKLTQTNIDEINKRSTDKG